MHGKISSHTVVEKLQFIFQALKIGALKKSTCPEKFASYLIRENPNFSAWPILYEVTTAYASLPGASWSNLLLLQLRTPLE